MREKVEELDRLVALEPVDYTDWAAPIVTVMKSDHKSAYLEIFG